MVRNIAGQGQFALSALTQRSQNLRQEDGSSSFNPKELLGSNKLLSDVEKHIDDVKKHKGYLSKGVAKEVTSRYFQSANELSDIDPKLSLLYNSVSTGLSYGRNARFVSGVSSSVHTTRRLLDLYS